MEKKSPMPTQCLRELPRFQITKPEMELSSLEKKIQAGAHLIPNTTVTISISYCPSAMEGSRL
jgi:hypothetical protein